MAAIRTNALQRDAILFMMFLPSGMGRIARRDGRTNRYYVT
jgi:hypothetical protein